MSTAESDEVALDRCLKLGAMNWMPFMIIVGSSPPYRFFGSMVHVMDIIAERLNTCYEFVIPDDWVFGTRLPNGSWTGIMGQLERGEVDMSGVTLSNDAARNAAVDFSEPLYMDTQVLSYKRPVLEADIAGFIKPKNEDKKQSPKLDTESKVLQQQKWESVWYSFQWTIGSTLAQSIPWMPRGNAVRVIAGLWLFSALIIASVYRSNLKAMLILPKLKLPFDSMEELVETDIPCNVPKGSMLYQAVLYAPPGSLLSRLKDQLVDTVEKDKAVSNLLSGVNAIFIGKIIIEFVAHQTFSQTRTCPLYIASQTFFGATSLGIAFKKGSPLKAKVDPIIRNLKEFGILDYLVRKEIIYAKECLRQESLVGSAGSLKPLKLKDFYGVFSLYGAGTFLASVVFLIELILRRKSDSMAFLRLPEASQLLVKAINDT
ncbi:glutamate receptor ionotropic, delta-2-like [Penaeus indicus]|uniref:glutamate receptor ionotropic, delta-2-like n=1 Tax=Penaeus indicus TaxID=29960 RepID=UPI00300C8B9A